MNKKNSSDQLNSLFPFLISFYPGLGKESEFHINGVLPFGMVWAGVLAVDSFQLGSKPSGGSYCRIPPLTLETIVQ